MYTVNNKFEIGEECYSVYRKPIDYKCPICEGKGYFVYNGHDIDCHNCRGTGKLHNPSQYVMDMCRVRVRRIIATIWGTKLIIKYKVDRIDNSLVSVYNRSETNLFKTAEEAIVYCDGVNTKQVTPEF